MRYTFSESFGFGPKYGSTAEFELELSEQEAGLIRAFLGENGDRDYAGLEFMNQDLFDRINEAANEAVLAAINRTRAEAGEPPLGFDEVDWQNMGYDFYWPKELLG